MSTLIFFLHETVCDHVDTVLSAVTEMAGTKDPAAIMEMASKMSLKEIVDAVIAYGESKGWDLAAEFQTLWDALPDSVQAAVLDATGGMTLEQIVAGIKDGSITMEHVVEAANKIIEATGVTAKDALAALKKHCPKVSKKFFS